MSGTNASCKECGAVGEIVVDYSRGEMYCQSCGVVAAGGLLEDNVTAWNEDGTFGQINQVRFSVSGGRLGMNRDKEDIATRATEKAISFICDELGTLQNVRDSAQNLADDYRKTLSEMNMTLGSGVKESELLAVACVHLASLIEQVPINEAELRRLPRVAKVCKSGSAFHEMVHKVVRDVHLENDDSYLAANSNIYENTAHRLLSRLDSGLRVAPLQTLCPIIAKLAGLLKNYTTVYSDGSIVAAMTVLAMTEDTILSKMSQIDADITQRYVMQGILGMRTYSSNDSLDERQLKRLSSKVAETIGENISEVTRAIALGKKYRLEEEVNTARHKKRKRE